MPLSINTADALASSLSYLFGVDDTNAIKEFKTNLALTTTGVTVNNTTAPFGRSFRPDATTLVGAVSGVSFTPILIPNNAAVSVFVVANQFVNAPTSPSTTVPLFTSGSAPKKSGAGIHYDPASGKITHSNAQGTAALSGVQLTTGTVNTGSKTFGFSRSGATTVVGKVYIDGALDAAFAPSGIASNSLFGDRWPDSELAFIGGAAGFGWALFDYVYIAVFIGTVLTDADFARLHASATGSNAFALISGAGGGGGGPALSGVITPSMIGNASFTADWAAATGGTAPYTYDLSTDGGTSYVLGWTANTRNLSGLASPGSLVQFRVRARDNTGALSNVLSAAVQLATTPDAPPSFPVSPQSGSYTVGQTATLTWTAAGTPTPILTLQRSTNGLSWTDVAASGGTFTTAALTLGDTGVQYRVRGESSIASTPTTNYSAVATLTVTAAGVAPSITTHPTGGSFTAGAAITLTAAASGSPTPAVQWQRSTDGGTVYNNVSGATSTTLALTAAVSGGAANNGDRFRAVFTNATSPPATSNPAVLVVNAGGTGATVTSDPLTNSAGGLLPLTTIAVASLLADDMSTVVARFTSQTTNSAARLSLNNTSLVPGARYWLATKSADGASYGIEPYTAA